MSHCESNKISHRQAVAASLGAVGITAVGTVGALAEPRPSGLVKGKRVLVLIGEFSEGLETYYMIYRLMEEGARAGTEAVTYFAGMVLPLKHQNPQENYT